MVRLPPGARRRAQPGPPLTATPPAPGTPRAARRLRRGSAPRRPPGARRPARPAHRRTGTSGWCARSVITVARPAASSRSHEADVSPLVGQRRHAPMSAACMYAGRSASETNPAWWTRSGDPKPLRVGDDVIVAGRGADQEQVQVGTIGGQSRDRVDDLRQPLLGREAAERADDDVVGLQAVARAHLAGRQPARGRERIGNAHRDGLHFDAVALGEPRRQRRAVHRGEAGGLEHEAHQRPVAEERAAETLGDQQGEIGRARRDGWRRTRAGSRRGAASSRPARTAHGPGAPERRAGRPAPGSGTGSPTCSRGRRRCRAGRRPGRTAARRCRHTKSAAPARPSAASGPSSLST